MTIPDFQTRLGGTTAHNDSRQQDVVGQVRPSTVLTNGPRDHAYLR
jgi:hypothetical protein